MGSLMTVWFGEAAGDRDQGTEMNTKKNLDTILNPP